MCSQKKNPVFTINANISQGIFSSSGCMTFLRDLQSICHITEGKSGGLLEALLASACLYSEQQEKYHAVLGKLSSPP